MNRPVCFMVMPFNKKSASGHRQIDFNALWDRAFAPMLSDLGFDPIRADADLGSSIIVDMLIRLTASDLVIADLTIENANVYYEIGVRHAAREPGCVLIAADWARPLFDLQQIRRLPYPLPRGDLTDEVVRSIQDALREPIDKAKGAKSPVFQLVPGYPGDLPQNRSREFQAFVGHLTAFQAAATAITAAPAAQREAMATHLLERYPLTKPQSPAIILELLRIAADYRNFEVALDFVDRLPPDMRQLPFVLNQEALALGKCKRTPEAIAKLRQLLKAQGPDQERLGILGGRYKELWRAAVADGHAVDASIYLGKAIESYTSGMWLDLNAYYCAANLPRLLRSRGRPGDEDLARQATDIARNACERGRRTGEHDEWLNPTLLGVAIDAGDADQAEALLGQVIDEAPAGWKMETTLNDLRDSLAGQGGTLAPEANDRLAAVLQALEALIPPTVT
jgi:tetratricopeptide (TPR) repeat protein